MRTGAMQRGTEASARWKARMAGVFYLLNIFTAVFSMFGGGSLIVGGDAAATATNIMSHELLFRGAFAANLIATACYLVVTLLLYDLLKPVHRSVSLLAAFFSLVGCAVGALSSVFPLAVLVVLGGTPYLGVFSMAQLQAMARLFLKMQAQTLDVSIVFFGFYCLLVGYLIFRSNFLPRLVGALVALSGVGWLTYLYAPLANSLSTYLPISGLLGEGSLTIWLLAVGVNTQRWKQASESARQGRTEPAG